MKVLVLGATGATGKLAVKQLLEMGHEVRALVRSPGKVVEHARYAEIEGTALSLSSSDIEQHVAWAEGVVSCLGHTLSFQGIYGAPRMLVKQSIARIASIATQLKHPIKLVLMNTTGNRNLDRHEPVGCGHHIVLWLLRALLPPHLDNERAANLLRTQYREHPFVDWIAVRPDGLIDEDQVSDYTIHPSPTRSAIFDAGQTSRMNVAHLMANLLSDDNLWEKWKGEMPVIYNQPSMQAKPAGIK